MGCLAFIRGARPGFARQVPSARPPEGRFVGARLPDSKNELCLLGSMERRSQDEPRTTLRAKTARLVVPWSGRRE
jgi:hypothetical protein